MSNGVIDIGKWILHRERGSWLGTVVNAVEHIYYLVLFLPVSKVSLYQPSLEFFPAK